MRRLWITRHKAMAGCAMKMKVFIEDPEDGDTEINGVLCRKLGELKNDQQKHFNIGPEAAKVFVVADKVSRNIYNEFVEIPAGQDDVFLSGKNYLKPSEGNPFRFDGVEQEETLENRETVKRRGRGILIAAIVVGILAGIAAGIFVSASLMGDTPQMAQPQTQAFQCQELQIMLPEAFAETAVPGYTGCYSDGETAVFLMREAFAAEEGFGELSVEEYGNRILANNYMDGVTLETRDGLTVFAKVIADEATGIDYYYYCGLFKGQDAFWMVQITTDADGASENISQFRQWLKTVALTA